MWRVKPRDIIKIFLVFLLGFAFGIGIKYVYEITAFKPYSWGKNRPVIVNCYGNDFSEAQFVRAIHFWTIRGHGISFYEHNPPETICEEEHIEGFIILRKGTRFSHDSGVLAHTRRWTSLTTLNAAVITYRPGSQNLAWINEHELGHALGFSHVEEVGHIMHPLFHKMSGKFWIP